MTTPTPLKHDQVAYLLQLAQNELVSLIDQSQSPVGDDPEGLPSAFVNVTLRKNGFICGSMGSNDRNICDAVRSAVAKAYRDTRFKRSVQGAELNEILIELWIETCRVPITRESLYLRDNFRLGLHGVKLTKGKASAYFKPSVALTKEIGTVDELLVRLSRKAGLSDTAWTENDAVIERSDWIHVVAAHSTPVFLKGLRPVINREPNPDSLRTAASLCLTRMANTQQDSGFLHYKYKPFRDEWIEQLHLVRQAGCAYSLARATASIASAVDHRRIRSAAFRLIRTLFEQQVEDSSQFMFIRDDRQRAEWGNLGATALTSLACQYFGEESFPESTALVKGILDRLDGSGAFLCGRGRELGDFKQNYYPGEALLALVCYGRRTLDCRVFDTIARTFRYYSRHFERAPATSFILWQSDVWTSVAQWILEGSLHVPDLSLEQVCAFVFLQIDWLLQFQHTSDKGSPDEYVGGFHYPDPPNVHSACYVEAAIRGCVAAKIVQDDRRFKRYRQAALDGLRFLMRLQVLPELAPFYPHPEFTVGGISQSLDSFEMRCDHDQHFVTACITGLETPCLWNSESVI